MGPPPPRWKRKRPPVEAASIASKTAFRLSIRSNQQGAHQQRPAGPHTQCRPARQLAPGPPQAVLMTGEKFFAVMARFPDPPVTAASAFQVSAPANRIAAEAASMSMSFRIDSSRFFVDRTRKVFTGPAKKATRSNAA
jgi:hypothetical protein